MEKTEWFLQEDIKHFVRETLGNEPWVTVYQNKKDNNEEIFFYSVLIPYGELDGVLDAVEFDVTFPYFGFPQAERNSDDPNQVDYLRFGGSSGIEPLVFLRDFHGVKSGYLEVSQEFVHFFNLFYDNAKNCYVLISEDGAEEEIITIANNSQIKIKRKQIKQFLAFKEMYLGMYFETTRFIDLSAEEIGLSKDGEDYKEREDSYHFEFWYHNLDLFGKEKAFSRLLGKKIISGMHKEDSGIYPFENKRQYQDFIVGQEENGKDILYTCEPDKLANYFGKNPEAPLYVAPVFFSKDVLRKYYDDPDKYLIEDGYLSCGRLWGLRMDNHHDDYVIILLGDLGHLSHTEQLYWKHFNISPTGTFSEAIFKRYFLAEFAEPETVDLVFRNKLKQVQEKWTNKFGWNIFKALNEGDGYHLTGLRVPIKNTQLEFDGQVLSLTMVIIDCLNEQELRKHVGDSIASLKGISKLEKFFETNGYNNYEDHVKFLRNLQDLRSTGSAHRKSENYVKAAQEFQLGQKDFVETFTEILRQAIAFLDFLDSII